MIYGSLIAFCLVIILILSIPVTVRLDSNYSCLINWFVFKGTILVQSRGVVAEVRLFNYVLFPRPPKKSQAPKKVAPPKEKSARPITRQLVLTILQDAVLKKMLLNLLRLLIRSVKAIKISFLRWNIGLNDYYWQGILMGLVTGLPKRETFQINGNFQEQNDFDLIAKISVWRIMLALLLFLIRFPYLSTLRLYLKIR